MDFSDTREEAAFREKARAWLAENLPQGIANRGFALAIDDETVRLLTEWQRRLWEAGYLGLSWPKEYGGQGASMIESAIFNEEMARVRAPAPLNEFGLSMGGPTDPRTRHRRSEAALLVEDSFLWKRSGVRAFQSQCRGPISPRSLRAL